MDEKFDSIAFCEIYTELIKELPLLPEHRALLKSKRGFSDETIDKLRFRSCAPSLETAIVNLANTFSAKDLKTAGIFINDSINPKLLADNILIPFLDGERVLQVKPHKNAFSGIALKPYVPAPLKSFALICESEFKAAAAWQLGYSSIGLSGVSSFSGKHLPQLCETLRSAGTTVVCIIFDNETKNNPAFPNYKKHFWNRWDTEYYSYLMALKLEQNGFEATIATLPDAWRENGKIDIDGALAQGKTKENFDLVVRARKSPSEYLKSLPRDAQQLIQRLVLKSQTHFPIWIESGRYMAFRGKGDEAVPTVISNFTMSIEANIYGADKSCRREVTLINDVGDEVSGATMEGDHLSHYLSFRKRCLSLGNYQWNGAQKDLEALIGFESAREIGKKIYQPDHVGWCKDGEIYLFDNCGVSKAGERHEVDEDGVVWLGLSGYQAVSLLQGGEDERGNIPRLWHQDIDPESLIAEIERNFGGDMGVRLACAWLCATFFSHELCKIYGSSFPLLFISGQAESGKSTLARWLSAMGGITTEGNSYWSGTLVGFQRSLGYYSSLPVWADEYRNSTAPAMIAKEGFIRSAYDGQTSPKGMRADFGLRSGAVRGRLIISGEDTPHDQALQQRCVTIRLSGKNKSGQDYLALNGRAEQFSGIIPPLIRRYHANKTEIFKAIHVVREHLRGAGLDDRTSITYAIVLGAYDGLIKANDKPFMDYITGHACSTFALKESEKPYHQFIEGIIDMKQRGMLNGNMLRSTSEGIAIYMHGTVSMWRRELRKEGADFPFKPGTIITAFEEAGWLVTKKSVRMNGTPMSCVILDPNRDDKLRVLYDKAEDEEQGKGGNR